MIFGMFKVPSGKSFSTYAPLGSSFDFPKPFNPSPREQDSYWRAAEHALVFEHLTGKGFVYLWDEPKKENYREMIELATRVKRDAPDLRILVTTSEYEKLPRNPELEKSIDLFVPVMNDWDGDFNLPAMARYRELQAQGKRLWTYLSCMSHGCSGEVESGLPDWVLDRRASGFARCPGSSAA